MGISNLSFVHDPSNLLNSPLITKSPLPAPMPFIANDAKGIRYGNMIPVIPFNEVASPKSIVIPAATASRFLRLIAPSTIFTEPAPLNASGKAVSYLVLRVTPNA